MKAAFVDPTLRVIYYTPYDILTASDIVTESDDDVQEDE